MILIQWLGIFGILPACTSNIGSVYLALGRPRIIAGLALVTIAVMAPLLVWLVPCLRLIRRCLALLASSIGLPLNLWLLRRLLGLRLGMVMGVIWRPVIANLVMAMAVCATQTSVPLGNRVIELFLYVLLGVFVYIASTLVLWWISRFSAGAESILLQAAADKLKSVKIRFGR